jgi:hypothetical protein
LDCIQPTSNRLVAHMGYARVGFQLWDRVQALRAGGELIRNVGK